MDLRISDLHEGTVGQEAEGFFGRETGATKDRFLCRKIDSKRRNFNISNFNISEISIELSSYSLLTQMLKVALHEKSLLTFRRLWIPVAKRLGLKPPNRQENSENGHPSELPQEREMTLSNRACLLLS